MVSTASGPNFTTGKNPSSFDPGFAIKGAKTAIIRSMVEIAPDT